MDEQTQKTYSAPAIVLEMDLETRAGSSLIPGVDELLDGE
jgi:hypothetical protein